METLMSQLKVENDLRAKWKGELKVLILYGFVWSTRFCMFHCVMTSGLSCGPSHKLYVRFFHVVFTRFKLWCYVNQECGDTLSGSFSSIKRVNMPKHRITNLNIGRRQIKWKTGKPVSFLSATSQLLRLYCCYYWTRSHTELLLLPYCEL